MSSHENCESGQVWLLSGQWFRGWYNRALDHPDVELIRGDTATVYHAAAINDPNTLDGVIRLRRGMESTSGWWLGRALLLFAPFKALRLDAPEADN